MRSNAQLMNSTSNVIDEKLLTDQLDQLALECVKAMEELIKAQNGTFIEKLKQLKEPTAIFEKVLKKIKISDAENKEHFRIDWDQLDGALIFLNKEWNDKFSTLAKMLQEPAQSSIEAVESFKNYIELLKLIPTLKTLPNIYTTLLDAAAISEAEQEDLLKLKASVADYKNSLAQFEEDKKNVPTNEEYHQVVKNLNIAKNILRPLFENEYTKLSNSIVTSQEGSYESLKKLLDDINAHNKNIEDAGKKKDELLKNLDAAQEFAANTHSMLGNLFNMFSFLTDARSRIPQTIDSTITQMVERRTLLLNQIYNVESIKDFQSCIDKLKENSDLNSLAKIIFGKIDGSSFQDKINEKKQEILKSAKELTQNIERQTDAKLDKNFKVMYQECENILQQLNDLNPDQVNFNTSVEIDNNLQQLKSQFETKLQLMENKMGEITHYVNNIDIEIKKDANVSSITEHLHSKINELLSKELPRLSLSELEDGFNTLIAFESKLIAAIARCYSEEQDRLAIEAKTLEEISVEQLAVELLSPNEISNNSSIQPNLAQVPQESILNAPQQSEIVPIPDSDKEIFLEPVLAPTIAKEENDTSSKIPTNPAIAIYNEIVSEFHTLGGEIANAHVRLDAIKTYDQEHVNILYVLDIRGNTKPIGSMIEQIESNYKLAVKETENVECFFKENRPAILIDVTIGQKCLQAARLVKEKLENINQYLAGLVNKLLDRKNKIIDGKMHQKAPLTLSAQGIQDNLFKIAEKKFIEAEKEELTSLGVLLTKQTNSIFNKSKIDAESKNQLRNTVYRTIASKGTNALSALPISHIIAYLKAECEKLLLQLGGKKQTASVKLLQEQILKLQKILIGKQTGTNILIHFYEAIQPFKNALRVSNDLSASTKKEFLRAVAGAFSDNPTASMVLAGWSINEALKLIDMVLHELKAKKIQAELMGNKLEPVVCMGMVFLDSDTIILKDILQLFAKSNKRDDTVANYQLHQLFETAKLRADMRLMQEMIAKCEEEGARDYVVVKDLRIRASDNVTLGILRQMLKANPDDESAKSRLSNFLLDAKLAYREYIETQPAAKVTTIKGPTLFAKPSIPEADQIRESIVENKGNPDCFSFTNLTI